MIQQVMRNQQKTINLPTSNIDQSFNIFVCLREREREKEFHRVIWMVIDKIETESK